jgi:hypothetical protein
MLNSSIDAPFTKDMVKLRHEREQTLDYGSTSKVATEYSSLASIAPSQMAQQVLKI